MLHLQPMFRAERVFLHDPQPKFDLRDAAKRPVTLSAHLRRDLALDHGHGVTVESVERRPWRIGFRWPVYLRALAH